MSRAPFYLPTDGDFDTTIDSPEWSEPRSVTVHYECTADEIRDITVCNVEGVEIEITPQQERDLIEEIWEDYTQNGDS